jgi:hypothetical protein
MNQKPGIATSEFWLTAVVNIAGAVIALLAAFGLVKEEHGQLWLSLVQALAVAAIPLALAWINSSYIKSRAAVKNSRHIPPGMRRPSR